MNGSFRIEIDLMSNYSLSECVYELLESWDCGMQKNMGNEEIGQSQSIILGL